MEGSAATIAQITDEGTYTITLGELTSEEGEVSAIDFFGNGSDLTAENGVTVKVTVHSGSYTKNDDGTYSVSEAGTYTVTLTLDEGYVWSDGTTGDREYTFTVTE